jgi:hypothetical protein
LKRPKRDLPFERALFTLQRAIFTVQRVTLDDKLDDSYNNQCMNPDKAILK